MLTLPVLSIIQNRIVVPVEVLLDAVFQRHDGGGLFLAKEKKAVDLSLPLKKNSNKRPPPLAPPRKEEGNKSSYHFTNPAQLHIIKQIIK